MVSSSGYSALKANMTSAHLSASWEEFVSNVGEAVLPTFLGLGTGGRGVAEVERERTLPPPSTMSRYG